LADLWCHSCDSKTIHEVRFTPELNFVHKILFIELRKVYGRR